MHVQSYAHPPADERGRAAERDPQGLPAGGAAAGLLLQLPGRQHPRVGRHHAHHIQTLRHPVLHLRGGPAGVGPGHPGSDPGLRGGTGQVLRERLRAGLHLPLGPRELHPGRDHHGRHGAGDQHQPHPGRRVGAEQDARCQHQGDERAHLGADDLGRRAGAEDQRPAVQLHFQLHVFFQAMTARSIIIMGIFGGELGGGE